MEENAQQIRVIPAAMEIERVRVLATQEPTLALDWSVPAVVGVGRLAPQKGFTCLLEAFARLGPARPCRLLILGHGPERAVLTRTAEGLPAVIVEAMACGVPVISTDCPSGPAELIVDRENGRGACSLPAGDRDSTVRGRAGMDREFPMTRRPGA